MAEQWQAIRELRLLCQCGRWVITVTYDRWNETFTLESLRVTQRGGFVRYKTDHDKLRRTPIPTDYMKDGKPLFVEYRHEIAGDREPTYTFRCPACARVESVTHQRIADAWVSESERNRQQRRRGLPQDTRRIRLTIGRDL